jgi:hypothetical protein
VFERLSPEVFFVAGGFGGESQALRLTEQFRLQSRAIGERGRQPRLGLGTLQPGRARGRFSAHRKSALMTGQYSIRNGLSLIVVPGGPNALSARAVTMGDVLKGAGYATAIFGKWHLGSDPQSLPTAHGFDEFYGIPPDLSWDSCQYADSIALTKSIPAPLADLVAQGPYIVEAVAGGPLRKVKPFTPGVRAEIDNELVAKSIDFMKRHKAAGKPFFLYLPFSMGHAPNLPSQQFQGKSRIGNYGDKMMEGDYHVGQIIDTLKHLGIDDGTIVVFASDNGPCGETMREFGNLGTPDMASPGPLRGELGEATEGSIRTAALIRWPGRVKPNSTSYAILDHGFPSDLRPHRGRENADGPGDRRRGPDRCLARYQPDGPSRRRLELHRSRPSRHALEAVAYLLHRRSCDRHRTAATTRSGVGQCSDGRLPESVQRRDGPA